MEQYWPHWIAICRQGGAAKMMMTASLLNGTRKGLLPLLLHRFQMMRTPLKRALKDLPTPPLLMLLLLLLVRTMTKVR